MKRADFILVSGAVLLALMLIGVFALIKGKDENVINSVAAVYSNGVCVARLPLDKADTYLVSSPNGGENLVETDGAGNVRMHSANCKNQLCVLQGWIGKDYLRDDGVWIVCLPNGVSLTIESEGAK